MRCRWTMTKTLWWIYCAARVLNKRSYSVNTVQINRHILTNKWKKQNIWYFTASVSLIFANISLFWIWCQKHISAICWESSAMQGTRGRCRVQHSAKTWLYKRYDHKCSTHSIRFLITFHLAPQTVASGIRISVVMITLAVTRTMIQAQSELTDLRHVYWQHWLYKQGDDQYKPQRESKYVDYVL